MKVKKVPLRDIYKNRFLLWRVLFVSMRVNQESPILNFGEKTRLYLAPARGIIAKITAEGEFKRACGLPFVEEKFLIALVRDRSDETGRDVLKAVVMREKDLKDYQSYLDNPPAAGKNFRLYKHLGRAYAKSPEAFLPVMIVMA